MEIFFNDSFFIVSLSPALSVGSYTHQYYNQGRATMFSAHKTLTVRTFPKVGSGNTIFSSKTGLKLLKFINQSETNANTKRIFNWLGLTCKSTCFIKTMSFKLL